ncbi:phosphoenolpyruvate--protein phosphotransferase [candidate division KSB1 bacterium]|nr:phosphoenolpyruvate--protein phosphotransferase [candidate division KSB1 bacterium]
MTKPKEIKYAGIGAAPGVAIGKIYSLSSRQINVENKTLKSHEIEPEVEKFRHAVEKSKNDLKILQNKTEEMDKDTAQIFQVHISMLDDVVILEETIKSIRENKKNSDMAFLETMEQMEKTFDNIEDDYLKARAADLRDIKWRVIRHIQGKVDEDLNKLKEPVIVFSRELTPSETVKLDRSLVLGFITEVGGRNSHAAIMARSLKIPSVVGLPRDLHQFIHTGDQAILDGNKGILIMYPTLRTTRQFEKKQKDIFTFEKSLDSTKKLPARTKDGKDIDMAANIEFIEEVESIKDLGAQGVGLFRTEYLYLAKDQLPTEEEQFIEYSQIIKKLDGKPIVIRTFDLGGDKMPQSFRLPKEENPFLGVRAIRIATSFDENIFTTQLRAIVRASVFGNVRILFPMISCVSEIRYCQNMVNKVKKQLKTKGIKYAEKIPIGAMIEVPSAAVIADLIAKECDFLSIGTNDLIQYSLAVDRGNEYLAYLYKPFNPAILRLIRDIIIKGHERGVWVGMCGEMASDPMATMVLLGLGLDEFSVSAPSLLRIKTIIRSVEYSECEKLAKNALSFNTSQEVENYLEGILEKKFKYLIQA